MFRGFRENHYERIQCIREKTVDIPDRCVASGESVVNAYDIREKNTVNLPDCSVALREAGGPL